MGLRAQTTYAGGWGRRGWGKDCCFKPVLIAEFNNQARARAITYIIFPCSQTIAPETKPARRRSVRDRLLSSLINSPTPSIRAKKRRRLSSCLRRLPLHSEAAIQPLDSTVFVIPRLIKSSVLTPGRETHCLRVPHRVVSRFHRHRVSALARFSIHFLA